MRRTLQQTWLRSGIFWVQLVLMIVISMVVLYTYFAYRQAATDLVLERDHQLAVLSAARLREEIATFADNLASMARSSTMTSGKMEEKKELLRQNASRLMVFDGGMILFDDHGVVRATQPHREEIHGLNWSDRTYFKGILLDNRYFVSDVTQDGPEGSYVVVVSIPILGDEGQFVGGLAGMFKLGEQTLSAFYASVVRLRLGQTGSTYIVDGKRQIIFDSGSDKEGSFLESGHLPGIKAGAPAGTGLAYDEEGNRVVAAHAPIPGTKWTLITEDDWMILTQSTRKYSRTLLISFGAAMLLPPLSLAVINRRRHLPILGNWLPSSKPHVITSLQESLQPSQVPLLPGWDVGLQIRSWGDKGHMFQDALVLADGRMLLSMAHTIGSGAQGMLTLASTRSLLRAVAQNAPTPGEALAHCNSLLCAESTKPSQIDCSYLCIDPSTGCIDFAIAGEGSIFICKEGIHRVQHPPGPPLGTKWGLIYETGQIALSDEDCLFVLSEDMLGVTDRKGRKFGELMGSELFHNRYRSTKALADHILHSYKSFRARSLEVSDETGVVVLKRLRMETEDENLHS